MIVNSNRNTERLLESQRTDLTNYIVENNSKDTSYPYRTFPLLDNPYSNAIPSYFYPQIGGYTGAKLSIIQDVMYNGGPLDVQSNSFNPQLLDLFNVKYLTYTSGLPLQGFEPVFEGERGVVYENQNVLPKAFFVDSIITVNSPRQAFDYIQPQQIDLSETAVVETNDQITTSADSISSVNVTNYTGPEITL
ncbi:MAG: hypothetical protein U5K71_11170 [Gracilimonas sp.]|nr:hypothetical protein [Gracilimonas sp.]